MKDHAIELANHARPDLLAAAKRAIAFVRDPALTSQGVFPPSYGDPIISRGQAAEALSAAVALAEGGQEP